mmetsp:Transcript_7044/g.20563  ORF Transcript_7044/g.20563 Transcript_7044/m.20563 type:complete len:248 (-) Transcript_7044:2982-3725(-)
MPATPSVLRSIGKLRLPEPLVMQLSASLRPPGPRLSSRRRSTVASTVLALKFTNWCGSSSLCGSHSGCLARAPATKSCSLESRRLRTGPWATPLISPLSSGSNWSSKTHAATLFRSSASSAWKAVVGDVGTISRPALPTFTVTDDTLSSCTVSRRQPALANWSRCSAPSVVAFTPTSRSRPTTLSLSVAVMVMCSTVFTRAPAVWNDASSSRTRWPRPTSECSTAAESPGSASDRFVKVSMPEMRSE